MARSTYVYVLSQYSNIYGTFTVKHELISAARRKIPEALWCEYRVQRYLDGCFGSVPEMFTLNQFIGGP